MRLDKITALLKLADGKIESRKKLHKLIYLLQSQGEDFGQGYTYLLYGVYSPTLADDLELAEQLGFLEQQSQPGIGFTIKLKKEIAHSAQMPDLAKKLLDKTPRFLEALSTIIYVHHFFCDDKLLERCTELKPHLKTEIDEALPYAQKEGLLNG